MENFRKLTDAKQKKLLRQTFDERKQFLGGNSIDSYLTEWPIMKSYESISFDFKVIKNVKSLDKFYKRISRRMDDTKGFYLILFDSIIIYLIR